MNGENASLPRTDIEKQLTTLLASDLFAASFRLSALLERLVKDNLNSSPIDEYRLGVELFGRRENWIPMDDAIVRQNTKNLRDKLARYYKEVGAEDLIIIAFPNGFTAKFSYNPTAPVAAKCRDIITFFYQSFPAETERSALAMDALLYKHPSYALGHAHWAEMLVAQAVCGPRYSHYCITKAEEAIATCLALDHKSCIAQIMSGVLHSCRFRWEAAEDAFQSALRIDPAQTRMSFWYIAYLMARYRFDEAFQCIKARQELKSFDIGTWIIEAAFFYVTRNFKGAESTVVNHLAESLGPYRYDDRPPVLNTLDCCNWLVEILMALIMLALRNPTFAYQYARKAGEHGAPEAFDGLEDITAKYTKLRPAGLGITWNGFYPYEYAMKIESERLGPVGAAMARFARNRFDEAIEVLKKAVDEGYPLMAWLHILPLFYRVRAQRKFVEIVDRTAPPH